jgi:pentapeptide MXKDX repeat protein
MTTTRTRLLRLAVPVAAAVLALSACASSSSESSTSDSGEMTASAMASDDAMESDAMESDAMASDEMTPHSDDAMSDDAMSDDAMSDDAMSDDAAMVEQAGAYVDYADYEANKAMYDGGTVVLFFNASWCPTCQETVSNLEADPAAIPAGLTVVSVDYDSADELKQKYGVTTQHTFVQVDASGTELKKWTGSADAEAIAKKTA